MCRFKLYLLADAARYGARILYALITICIYNNGHHCEVDRFVVELVDDRNDREPLILLYGDYLPHCALSDTDGRGTRIGGAYDKGNLIR